MLREQEFERMRNRVESIELLLLDVVSYNFKITHPYPVMVTNFHKLMGAEYANRRKHFAVTEMLCEMRSA